MEDSFEEYEVETDEEYEFEASRFYDFSRIELDYEIEEAERWFEVSGNYPPSPFIVKLNLEKILSVGSWKAEHINTKSMSGNSDSDNGVSNGKKESKGKNPTTPGKDKTGSDDKLLQPRTPSFMEPTASHLAKQRKNDTHYGFDCERFQKLSLRLGQNGSRSPTGSDIATKRQKLDVGCLRKVAHSKHQFFLMHKSTKTVTIPKEPELETMLRAQRRRSKNRFLSSETGIWKQKFCSFKAHPLNKKDDSGASFIITTEKTTERANRHASAKVYPGEGDTEITRDLKQKSTSSRERKSSTAYKLSEIPPTEQFSKLSLGPASQSGRHSSDKRCNNAKPKQCGDHIRWSGMSRILDIG